MPEILIVEDSESDAGLLERALRNAGVVNSVHHAWNAADGILYLAEIEKQVGLGEPPAGVMLVDIRLPGQSGFDILTLVKNRRAFSRTLRVVTSQLDDIDSIKNSYRLGAHSFLTKPVTSQDLTELIKMFHDHCQLQPEVSLKAAVAPRPGESNDLHVRVSETFRQNRELIESVRTNLKSLKKQLSDNTETFAIIDSLLDDLRAETTAASPR